MRSRKNKEETLITSERLEKLFPEEKTRDH